jgi:hypothetical protein
MQRGAQVYVYYRVRRTDLVQLIAAIRALHAQLRLAHPRLVCTLSRRVDDIAEPVTVMETYCHPDAPAAQWQPDVERGACAYLEPLLIGARHVETFVPCA